MWLTQWVRSESLPFSPKIHLLCMLVVKNMGAWVTHISRSVMARLIMNMFAGVRRDLLLYAHKHTNAHTHARKGTGEIPIKWSFFCHCMVSFHSDTVGLWFNLLFFWFSLKRNGKIYITECMCVVILASVCLYVKWIIRFQNEEVEKWW